MRRMMMLTCLLAALGCGDDERAQSAGMSGASTPPPQEAAPRDGDAAAGPPIALVDWVDDLLDHHTDEHSQPDSVHDKNIVDDRNPATFSARFRR